MKTRDFGLLILRIAIGGLMLFHGYAKLVNGIDGVMQLLSDRGIPGFVVYGVYLGEILAPLLIIVGYRTKLASIILLINMLVILFVAHAQNIFALTAHGGLKAELALFYLLTTIALLLLGPGRIVLSKSSRWD